MKTIVAERRTLVGTRRARRMREKGLVPGVVYGAGYSQPIQLKATELNKAIRENGRNRPYKLKLEDREVPVMIGEIQEQFLGSDIIHIDFKEIDMNQGVIVSVPLVLTGKPESGQAILVHHEIEIRCLPTDIPPHIEIAVDGLKEGDEIRVQDLKLPERIEVQMEMHEPLVTIEELEELDGEEAGTASAEQPEPQTV